ncbi:type II toxin-antitoxin system Phd/YefM family antitoxin [Thiothrix subterranea]|uniref:Antitoxin n=1 Tax=Thiothrix subterranea TaxID=2735563 RepID=A0AA51R5R8_9GAMM|nr:type II toxin-antitoxin system Phd/YefM family antitoxin [Thiothrix subterranea]MDQ5767053.1 type II toxin-antitoxin system Phd/YefM family antitoxin [Thiothrix subterranea]WML88085.1 type II toxin-antitoxin system Phd/YefM family antitoxin [Thiothrix subterranea]
MSEAAISTLKNHLPEWVHLAESGQDIQITRHGKPVAVMISLAKYQRAFVGGTSIVSAFSRWREQYPDAQGFTADEQEQMYSRTREPYPDTASVWD